MAKDPDTTDDMPSDTASDTASDTPSDTASDTAKSTAAPPQGDPSDRTHDGEAAALDDDEHLEQLATQFLALWREQVAATADGSQAASAIGRLYASLGADTTRMGEGFEAWGNLIGQMAMGQHPAAGVGNPLGAGAVPGMVNPLQEMMDQMARAVRDLPTRPFPGVMPFPPNMAAMAGMTGTPQSHQTSPDKTAPSDDGNTDADVKPAAKGAKKASKNTRAAKDTAKGQDKNDQSAKTKAASAQKAKPEAGGATAAADAHGSRDDELAQLARRIADLSETIAALEAGTEGSGGETSD